MNDLDGNGRMSKDEFFVYNIRTSGDICREEEWKVVEGNIWNSFIFLLSYYLNKFNNIFFSIENVTMEENEITKKGFFELNQMEADECEGDTSDLWVTLSSMGFNKQLELTKVKAKIYSFLVLIY